MTFFRLFASGIDVAFHIVFDRNDQLILFCEIVRDIERKREITARVGPKQPPIESHGANLIDRLEMEKDSFRSKRRRRGKTFPIMEDVLRGNGFLDAACERFDGKRDQYLAGIFRWGQFVLVYLKIP